MSPNIRNQRYHGDEEFFFGSANRSIEKALSNGHISESDAKYIRQYTGHLKANISPGRYQKITSLLVNARRFFECDYANVTEDELDAALGRLKYAKKTEGTHIGEPYSENTKVDWRKSIKRFLAYLRKKGIVSIPEECLDEIQAGVYSKITKSETDVLTREEIEKLIQTPHSAKYKAYLGMLYELGARSIELANLRWKDIVFTQWGCQVKLTDYKAGITPKQRTVPMMIYSKLVADWRAQYQYGDPTGDSYVFVTTAGKPLQYRGVAKALSLFVKEAGITRKVTLHRIRHTRITHVLREGMNETIAKQAFWGNLSSGMIQTYAHLTDRDLEAAFSEVSGVKIEHEAVNETPKPITCPRCHKILPPGTRFCSECGQSLTPEAAADVSQAENSLDERFAKLSDFEKIRCLNHISK